MKYVVLVTEIITSAISHVVDAKSEEEAIKAAMAIPADYESIETRLHGEVLRALVPASAPERPSRDTVSMKKFTADPPEPVEVERAVTCTCGPDWQSIPDPNCPVHH